MEMEGISKSEPSQGPHSVFIESQVASLKQSIEGGLSWIQTQNKKLQRIQAPICVNIALGATGSGKTTTLQILGGDLSSLKVPEPPTHIIDTEDRIGAPSTDSKTSFPEFVVSASGSAPMVYLDCPGFEDNRGEENDICGMFLVRQVLTTAKVSKARFLFTIPFSALQTGNDRLLFGQMVAHGVKFLKKSEMREGIALVVTKVGNFNSNTGKPLEDAEVLEEVVRFLEMFRESLEKKLERKFDEEDQERVLKAIGILTKFLERDEDCAYRRIWFIRSPTKSGPLEESEYYKNVRSEICGKCDRLPSVEVEFSDFGVSLKAETKLKISQWVKHIGNDILEKGAELVELSVQKYLINFGQKFEKSQFFQCLPPFVEVMKGLQDLNSEKLESLPFSAQIKVFLKVFNGDLTLEDEALILKNIETQLSLVEFLADVSEEQLETPSASEILIGLQAKMTSVKAATWVAIHNKIVARRGDLEVILDSFLKFLSSKYKDKFQIEFEADRKKSFDKLTTHFDKLQKQCKTIAQDLFLVDIVRSCEALLELEVEPEEVSNLEILESEIRFLEQITNLTNPPILTNVAFLISELHSLKESALDKLRDDMPEVTKKVEESVGLHLSKFISAYSQWFKKELHSNLELTLVQFIEDEEKSLEFMRNLPSSSSKVISISTLLRKLGSSFKHISSELDLKSLIKLEKDLCFISQVTGIPRSLQVPKLLSRLTPTFKDLRTSTFSKIREETVPTLHTVAGDLFGDIVSEIELQFLRNLHSGINRDTLPSKISFLEETLQKLGPFSKKWERASIACLSSEIEKIFSVFGPLRPDTVNDLDNLQSCENQLDFLEDIMKTSIPQPILHWLTPAIEFHSKIQGLLEWFTFVASVASNLELYSAQVSLTRVDSVPSQNKLLDFIKTQKLIQVPSQIEQVFRSLSVEDKTILEDILDYVIKKKSKVKYDFDKDLLSVKGRYVKFSDFARDLEGYRYVDKVKVFASDVVFIDCDIEVIRKRRVVMTVLAPKWVIVGEKRRIDLSGEDGGNWEYGADGGSSRGEDGEDGSPGKRGRNGGAFVGRFEEIENGGALTILVNGGNGGRGQDGGYGAEGLNGENMSFSDFPDRKTVKVFSVLESDDAKVGLVHLGGKKYRKRGGGGGRGGKGGDGGVGGYPGHPGNVEVVGSEGEEHGIEICARKGVRGGGGDGGKGGIGGYDGDHYDCELESKVTPLLSWYMDVMVWSGIGSVTNYDRAQSGADGRRGANSWGATKRERPEEVTLEEGVVEEFREFVWRMESSKGVDFAYGIPYSF